MHLVLEAKFQVQDAGLIYMERYCKNYGLDNTVWPHWPGIIFKATA